MKTTSIYDENWNEKLEWRTAQLVGVHLGCIALSVYHQVFINDVALSV